MVTLRTSRTRIGRSIGRRPGAPLGAALLLCALAAPGTAQTLPAEAAALAGAREAGSGAFRFFGLRVYDAKLWTPGPGFDPAAPFAFGIRYARDIKGFKLAEESVNQWRRMRYGFEDRYDAWEDQMRRVFPDVKPDDELVGVHMPGRGALFYFNGKATGEVADTAFARAFFAIWLDERTTEPALRRALIGEQQ
jgi:hypothetical protein